jgi:ribosomal-protein-alanine N-acetyltransferase
VPLTFNVGPTVQPRIQSKRLLLRPYELEDASSVQRLAGDRRVAEPTAAVPHPYPDGAAQAWISTHSASFASRRGVSYAVTLASTTELVGTVSLLEISSLHARAEIGYWIGFEHWGFGYCTEALGMLTVFAEEALGLTRLIGRCIASNVGSARVLEKSGFSLEGRQAKHFLNKGGHYEDMLLFGRCSSTRNVT